MKGLNQVFCHHCGGIKKMIVGEKEIDWKEALTKYEVAPDAWCIC